MNTNLQRIGFMQGRLCNQVEGKIQAFPKKDWSFEIEVAGANNYRLIEWTVDFEGLSKNPLVFKVGRSKIKEICTKNNLKIPSLTGDCYMQKPFWKKNAEEHLRYKNLFYLIPTACSDLGIKKIIVPLVDNGGLENLDQELRFIDFMLKNEDLFNVHGVQLAFESDYGPQELARFIERLPCKTFGINYDIGNSASMGFDPSEEFDAYGERILNVHVKDRVKNGGTVPLLKGDANFPYVFYRLSRINYCGNFILQTARDADGNHLFALNNYRTLTEGWINQYFEC